MHQVEIRIEGYLDEEWAEWLDGFTLTHTNGDETLLAGSVSDQAALYGLIAKLRDLGVKLKLIYYKTANAKINNHSENRRLENQR